MLGVIGAVTWLLLGQWLFQVVQWLIFIDVSEDAQLRFEEELAKVSAERDTIEKAHLTLMEEHNQLKLQAVSL